MALTVYLLPALLVTLAATAACSSKEFDSNHVWLLGEDSGYRDNYIMVYSSCDTTNVVALTKDKMHVDYFTTVEQLRMVRFNLPMPAYLIANQMIDEASQDEVFVAVHNGSMSVNRFGEYTTFPISAISPTSLFIISHLACITSHHATHVLCVNLYSRTQQNCTAVVPSGSHGYANTMSGQHAYIVTQDQKTLYKLNILGDCLVLAKSRSGSYFGGNLWFSHDGTKLFLSTGLTLNADDLSDSVVLGNKEIGVVDYTSVSQLYKQGELLLKDDWPIMALHSKSPTDVLYFNWPSLSTNGTQALPVPQGYSVERPIRLQYCQVDFGYALVTYKQINDSSTLRTGVAYVKYYF